MKTALDEFQLTADGRFTGPWGGTMPAAAAAEWIAMYQRHGTVSFDQLQVADDLLMRMDLSGLTKRQIGALQFAIARTIRPGPMLDVQLEWIAATEPRPENLLLDNPEE
jgi:hypothetical protein